MLSFSPPFLFSHFGPPSTDTNLPNKVFPASMSYSCMSHYDFSASYLSFGWVPFTGVKTA